ncbi:MAG: RDD family protein [Pirellulaceae bacterium]
MTRTLEGKLDCFVRVVTPENIAFEYPLAGPFQRLPAFLVDVALRFGFLLGLVFFGSIFFSFVPFGSMIINVLSVLSFFLLSWFYGIFFETRFNGRTPGKMLFRLRTISTDGRPINASQAALRNILRLADMNVLLPLQVLNEEAPPMFVIPTMLVGLVSMTLTKRLQRVGDLAAGTMVVSEPRAPRSLNLQPEDIRAYGLAELIPVNYQLSGSLAQNVGLYMENRRRLNPVRRIEIAKHLALPLIKRFELLPDTSSDLLLCALYVRTFMSQAQRQEGLAKLRLSQPSVLPGTQRTRPSLPGLGERVASPQVAVRQQSGPPASGETRPASAPSGQGAAATELLPPVVESHVESGSDPMGSDSEGQSSG